MDYDSWLKRRLKTGVINNNNNKQALPSDSGCSGSKGSLVNYSMKNNKNLTMDYKQVKKIKSFSAFFIQKILNVGFLFKKISFNQLGS